MTGRLHCSGIRHLKSFSKVSRVGGVRSMMLGSKRPEISRHPHSKVETLETCTAPVTDKQSSALKNPQRATVARHPCYNHQNRRAKPSGKLQLADGFASCRPAGKVVEIVAASFCLFFFTSTPLHDTHIHAHTRTHTRTRTHTHTQVTHTRARAHTHTHTQVTHTHTRVTHTRTHK